MASWIEISCQLESVLCGLVEAYVASWIEMIMTVRVNLNPDVEAYVASWIEIRFLSRK